jgi:hypothetical protein
LYCPGNDTWNAKVDEAVTTIVVTNSKRCNAVAFIILNGMLDGDKCDLRYNEEEESEVMAKLKSEEA